MSGYTVSVGDTTTRVTNFRDARAVVAGAVTDFLADDPEAVARVAVVVNGAFESGAVEHSLIAHGRWSQTVMVHGEPVVMTIIKKRWIELFRRLAFHLARCWCCYSSVCRSSVSFSGSRTDAWCSARVSR